MDGYHHHTYLHLWSCRLHKVHEASIFPFHCHYSTYTFQTPDSHNIHSLYTEGYNHHTYPHLLACRLHKVLEDSIYHFHFHSHYSTYTFQTPDSHNIHSIHMDGYCHHTYLHLWAYRLHKVREASIFHFHPHYSTYTF